MKHHPTHVKSAHFQGTKVQILSKVWVPYLWRQYGSSSGTNHGTTGTGVMAVDKVLTTQIQGHEFGSSESMKTCGEIICICVYAVLTLEGQRQVSSQKKGFRSIRKYLYQFFIEMDN